MICALDVYEDHLDTCNQNNQNHNGLQDVLENLEPQKCSFLTLIGLSLAASVAHVLSLQLNLD